MDCIPHRGTDAVTLNYFDTKLEMKIQVDPRRKALAAALIQINPKQPNTEYIISFASKSLTETETCYMSVLGLKTFILTFWGQRKSLSNLTISHLWPFILKTLHKLLYYYSV